MAGPNVEAFVAEQRAKRANSGLDTRITDHAVYTLIEGLLSGRRAAGSSDAR